MFRGLVLFLLLSSYLPIAKAVFTGDFHSITDAELVSHYYSKPTRKPGEIIVMIFGIVSSQPSLTRDYRVSLEETKTLYQRLTGKVAKDVTVYGGVRPWIQANSLDKDIGRWGEKNAIPMDQRILLYRKSLLRLEEKLMSEADFILFDVRGFWLSPDGTEFLSDLNVGYVKESGRFGDWRAKITAKDAESWVGNFLYSPEHITALEYQAISAHPEYSSKTILSYAGVPLANENVRLIVEQGPNFSNKLWGTKDWPKQLRNLIRIHSNRVKFRASCSTI